MFFRLVILIAFILVFSACDFISPKNTSLKNQVLNDTIIDYHSVDVYPLLAPCNNCDTNEKQKLCFENEFVKKLKSSLEETEIRSEHQLTDTVYVDIMIDKRGKISVSKIYENPEIMDEIPKLDSILRQSINSFPEAIQPSLKRGIPVSSKFKLPVVVSIKNKPSDK